MTADQQRMIITNAGNVGIGTSTPGQKLDVVGNIRISGPGSLLQFADGTSQTTAAVPGATGPAGGDLSGTYPNPAVATVGGQTAANVASGAVLANAATDLNTASAIVKRDASSNFSAGTITATLSGNATTATTATNFSGSLTGEVTGTQAATVVSNAVSTNTANAIVRRDASGNFSAGTITASLSGNATTATSATTATNFSGSLAGEVTGTQGATVVSNAVPTNTVSAIVRRDGAGGFAAGGLTLFGKIDQTNIDGLVARGTFGSGAIPATGAGTRLMWYPGKAAFRAGRVDGAQWDDVSVGNYSIAMGYNSTASGFRSIAIGYNTTASNGDSTAIGVSTTTSGSGATAIGNSTTASGLYSTAMGLSTIASGTASTAMGASTTSSAFESTAMGYFTTASGNSSTATGTFTTASGNYSTAMGSFASTTDGGIARAGAFVYGDNSTTTLVTPSADNQFVVRAAGGTTFFSNSAMNLGVTLAASGTSWAAVSDRNRKEDFHPVNGEQILSKLAALPVTSWRYKNDPSAHRYIGPMAQDFHALFGLGTDTTIATLDVDGVSLAGIKALERRTADLQAQNATLRDQLERLMRRIEQLEGQLPKAQ
jgi:hypothetical protein